MKHTTLVFLVDDDRVLLAMKKRGMGQGRWNGPGGKVEPRDESYLAAAIRECQEEIGVTPLNLKKVAKLTFWLAGAAVPIVTHTYLTDRWQGQPTESEEMRPEWFARDSVPYHQMWDDDQYWLPHVLAGTILTGEFTFDQNEQMLSKVISLDATEGDLHA